MVKRNSFHILHRGDIKYAMLCFEDFWKENEWYYSDRVEKDVMKADIQEVFDACVKAKPNFLEELHQDRLVVITTSHSLYADGKYEDKAEVTRMIDELTMEEVLLARDTLSDTTDARVLEEYSDFIDWSGLYNRYKSADRIQEVSTVEDIIFLRWY